MGWGKQDMGKLDSVGRAKALREACCWGDEEAARALVKAGADALGRAPEEETARPAEGAGGAAAKKIEAGDTAMNCAARGGFLEVMRVLMAGLGGEAAQRAAALGVSGGRLPQTPAMAAAGSPNSAALAVLGWLMELEPRCAASGGGAKGPAWSAAKAGNARALAQVAAFAERAGGREAVVGLFDERDSEGRAPLHWALASGSGDASREAIERSTAEAFDKPDARGRGVWHCAVEGGSWEPFEELLSLSRRLGAPGWAGSSALRARDAMGFTALEAAAGGALSACKGAWAAAREALGPVELAEERARAVVAARRAGRPKVAEWLGARDEPGAEPAPVAHTPMESAREAAKRMESQAAERGPRRGRG